MKSKTTKVRRYLAAILTVLMIFQQATTSVIYASSEAAVPTVTEAPAAQTEETSEKQVEQTPEEKTPTEGENEGEDSATPTEAPAENEAEPEVTVTPAAEPTATEAPAVEATATPVPEATEVPEATPTEVPTAASFTTADGIASVNLTQPISANAKFVATAQDADSDYFYNNVDAAMGAWVESNGLSVVDATAYDMHFETDGQELAVNQSATVHINFPTAILTQKPENGIQTTYYVLHIKNGTAVPAGTVNGDANGAYSADITTDGFSPFVFVKATSEDAIQTAVATNEVVDVMTSVEIKGVGEGQSYNPDSENEREGSFKIVINFKEDDLGIQFARTMKYQIPQVLNITPVSGKKIISNDNGQKVEIGTYDIDSNGLVTINFNDKIDQNDAYSAYIDFEASFKTESVGKKNEYTVDFGHEIIKTFKFKPFETVTVTKTSTVDENDPTLFHYTVKVKAGETGATDVVLTDEMNGNVKLNGKFYKNGQEITHEKDQYNEKYTIKLGDLNPNEEVNITYDGKIPDDKLDNLNGEIDVYNKVVGKSSYSKETSVDVNNKYKYELLNKTDAEISEDKKTATWTITVNEGGNGNKLNLNGYTLIDNLENSNSAYKVDTTKPLWVTKDNGTPEQWAWSRVTLKAENSGWEYTFAEDTTSTYKFTYSTTVPSNESLNNLTIKNKASLKKDNKGPEKESSGTISNVGLPEDIIEKQDGQLVVDPDDATRYIKWIVNVKIPRSGYNNFWLEDSVQACYEGKAELQVTSIRNTDNPSFNEVGITSTNSALKSAINEWSLQRPDDARFFIKAKDGNNITLPAAENDYTVSIVYYTKMTSSGFESKKPLKNTATVHAENLQKSDEGQYTPDNTNSYIVKKSGYKAEDKKMCWTILLNSGAKQWGEGNYSIVDTFDNNQELDESSIKVELGYSEYNFSNDVISAYNVSVSENSFTINFTDLKTLSETTIFENKPCPVVKITYSTKLKDSVFANENKTDVKNKFVLKKEDKVIESANSRIEVGPFKPFEKKLLTEASGSNGLKATYEMTANPNQVYLSQSSTVDKPEDYVITDTLLSNMHYDANSLVVKKNDSEIDQSEYTATYENNVLTINIPNGDGKKYTITYDVYIKGEAGKEVTYKNSAVLHVKEKRYTQTTDAKRVKIQNTSAGASSKSYTISLEKWNENYTQKLQAKFTLSRYSNGNWVESRDITTDTQNAVSLGTVHKQNAQDILYADCLYKLEEVEAPKDYVKSDKPYYFVIVEGTRNVEVPSNENITYDSYIASENADGSWTIKDAIRLTNKKNENPTGSLTVEKQVAGNGGDKEKEFGFRVVLTDTNINGTYGDMTFASGIASFTLKHGESKTAKDLPNGIGYSVSEEDYSGDGYATTKTGETGTIAGGSSQKASFTNTRNIGSLTVSKTLVGNAVENDRYFKFEIQVEPKLDGTYSDVTFKEGKAEIQLKGGEQKVIEGLPYGTTYSVSEKDADGYEVSKSGETGSISQEKSSVAAFTNTRNTYGSLTVEKQVAGNGGDKEKEFGFRVVLTDTNINGTYGDMTFASGIASFTLKHGESKTAKDLPNGIGYSVSEEDYSGDGYATTKTGETGTIAGGSSQKASFTNTRNIGSLTVSKTLVGNAVENDRYFKFEIQVEPKLDGTYSDVTFKEGKAEIQLKGGEQKVIEGLPYGTTYSVSEKDADGYEVSKSGETGSISQEKSSVAAFTNTRNTYGSLTVEKQVAGNGGDKEKEFGFRVVLTDTNINGTYGDMTFASGIASFTLKHGESKTAKDLPNGIGYSVSEEDYSGDGYATTKTGETGTIAGGSSQKASFTNTRNIGSLTVSKTLVGNAVENDRYFKFEIQVEPKLDGTYSDVTFKEGKAEIQLKGGEQKVIEGLPYGTTYSVSEKDADGYEVSKSGETGSISQEKSSVAAFTNTRNTYGSLTVEKQVAGNGGDKEKEFGFRVVLTDTNINGTYGDMTFASGIASFTLKHGESKTAKDLPNGIGYSVSEEDYSGDGYATTKTGETGTIAGGSSQKASFTNTRNIGSLTVSKTLVGNAVENDRYFKFEIQVEPKLDGTYSDVTFKEGKAEIQLKGGEQKVIEGLPYGTTYSVSEKDADGYEVSKSGETGSISQEKSSVAAFTNTRNTYGSLTVEKQVAGNGGDKEKEFGFRVVLTDTNINGTYGDMTFASGIASFTLKHGESKTAKDLPNGIGYSVSEEDYSGDGYATTKTGEVGNIVGNDIQKSKFINTRNTRNTPDTTSITVTKAWVDNDNKGNKRPSEIKVQLYADGRESGSPVTLNEANKWTYTWTGLDEKNGGTTIAYTVKEVGTVDGYEASVSGDARTGYTITNTLKSGTLEIVKSITGDVSDSALTAEQKTAMTFTVTGPDGYSETVHYSDFADGKYTFQNLPLGEYTVTETNADMEGYKLTTTYSVDGGKVTVTNKETATITITNDYTKTKDVSVKISKVDADTYEVLGGAHLQVIDPDGKVVAEWDSDKDAYTLTDLKPGVAYTLHETAAPKGYKVAEDTTFQLNEDGTIDTANTTTAISDDTLLVKDEKKESKDVSVSVTKKLVTVDGTVIGAVDATYYVALYSDADCTQRVSDVLALNFKNASSSTVTFTGLEKGQTYYVGECEADGTCYLANICADGTMYMVDFSDGNAVTVDNADGSTTVYFDNQFENIPDGYYKEAELNITKKLVGSDGKAKNSNEIFYAGIFADEGFTQLSTDVSANIVPLDLAGGSEATAQVNVALPESGSITLYVTEVDSNGKPVAGAASFKYDVTVDNTQVTLNDDNLSANVVITNKENSTKVTPTPGTPNTPNTTGGFSGKSAVRTGDSTPIGGFIALFAAAAVIAGAAVFFKRRRKDEK